MFGVPDLPLNLALKLLTVLPRGSLQQLYCRRPRDAGRRPQEHLGRAVLSDAGAINGIGIKTGTDRTYENIVGSPATTWAARTTRLPVMWAVNNPLRPRKPKMSADPAIRLRTNGRARLARSVAAGAVTD